MVRNKARDRLTEASMEELRQVQARSLALDSSDSLASDSINPVKEKRT